MEDGALRCLTSVFAMTYEGKARRSSPFHFAVLIAAKCFLEPNSELTKKQTEISAG